MLVRVVSHGAKSYCTPTLDCSISKTSAGETAGHLRKIYCRRPCISAKKQYQLRVSPSVNKTHIPTGSGFAIDAWISRGLDTEVTGNPYISTYTLTPEPSKLYTKQWAQCTTSRLEISHPHLGKPLIFSTANLQESNTTGLFGLFMGP